jgi:hypothetical protein
MFLCCIFIKKKKTSPGALQNLNNPTHTHACVCAYGKGHIAWVQGLLLSDSSFAVNPAGLVRSTF